MQPAASEPRSLDFLPCCVSDPPIYLWPTGMAWFKLVFGVVYMAFGMFCLIVFFRARDVFEIRARQVFHFLCCVVLDEFILYAVHSRELLVYAVIRLYAVQRRELELSYDSYCCVPGTLLMLCYPRCEKKWSLDGEIHGKCFAAFPANNNFYL